MPVYIAETTKREARDALAFLVGDRWPLSTSSAGNAGGTTAVFSALSGLSAPDIINRYLHLRSGTNDGEWRFAQLFTESSGIITVPRAYTGQVASAVTAALHEFRPDLYTQAINQAIRDVYPQVYRPILSHVVPGYGSGYDAGGGATTFRVPRNMRDVLRVLAGGERMVADLFDRADSTTDPGAGWTESTGNWGVTGERFYSVDDADGDLAIRAEDMPNGYIQCIVRGTLASGVTYRAPASVFRCMEDYTGAVPAAASRSYLVVRLLNSVVDLRKVDVGTETSLTTATATTSNGVDYVLRVSFQGRTVRVWQDDVMLIDYELTGLNEKYVSYPRFGARWDKGGSPATAARIDDFQAWSAEDLTDVPKWEQQADRIGFTAAVSSRTLLHVEGRATLSVLTDDTTFEVLDTDTTDRMEIQLTEPAFGLFLTYAAHCLYEQGGQAPLSEAQAASYAQKSQRWLAKYQQLRPDHATPRPVVYRRSLF